VSPIRTRASPVKQEQTLQEFCLQVYQAVLDKLERAGRTSQAHDTKNEVLWHASRLWEGKHPKHRRVCRDVAWATSFVLGLLPLAGEETDVEQTATATWK